MKKEFGSNYASISDVNFKAKYRASCYCNAVQYEVCSDHFLILGVYQKFQRNLNQRAIFSMVCGLLI